MEPFLVALDLPPARPEEFLPPDGLVVAHGAAVGKCDTNDAQCAIHLRELAGHRGHLGVMVPGLVEGTHAEEECLERREAGQVQNDVSLQRNPVSDWRWGAIRKEKV